MFSRDSEFTMDSSGRDILGDVTHSGKTTILEGSSQESVKNCIDSNSERLLDEGKRRLSKGKAIVHDLPPPSPSNAKRLFYPLISGEFCQDNAGDKNKETDHSGLSSLSFGLIPGHCNESEDISTESDEALEDNYEKDCADVTGNLSHMVNGLPLSSSHDHNVDFLSLKENMVDGCGNLTQELLDSIGLGKPCSCSFCLKAAHMWMDLTFQDTRGRLIELQKSKKRTADQVAKVTQGFSKLSKSTKLESDLMQNWKSIFIHTQDALAREIAQTNLSFSEYGTSTNHQDQRFLPMLARSFSDLRGQTFMHEASLWRTAKENWSQGAVYYGMSHNNVLMLPIVIHEMLLSPANSTCTCRIFAVVNYPVSVKTKNDDCL